MILPARMHEVHTCTRFGAPFTMAAYAIEGGPSTSYARTKAFMYAEPAAWHTLCDRFATVMAEIATVLAVHHRVSPPTINLDDQDPEVELDIATKARDLPQGDIAALNNSFGFGGANVAVAFGSVT